MGPIAAYVIEKLGEALASAEGELGKAEQRIAELEKELAGKPGQDAEKTKLP